MGYAILLLRCLRRQFLDHFATHRSINPNDFLRGTHLTNLLLTAGPPQGIDESRKDKAQPGKQLNHETPWHERFRFTDMVTAFADVLFIREHD